MADQVQIAQGSLNVVDRGQGPVWLLVHGFPLNHAMWQAQIDALSQVARVLAPDLPGFGASPSHGDVLSMESAADALAELLDALAITTPVVLCGFSMGGYIGWQFARRHAARLGKLVLCDTKAAPDTPAAAENRRQRAEQVLTRGLSPLAAAMLPKLLGSHTRQSQAGLVRQVEEMILGCNPQGVAAALLGMAERADAQPWLAEIKVPCLLVVGAEDAISPPAEMRQIAAGLPDARLVEIPQAGHLTPWEAPAAVNAALLDWGIQARSASE